MTTKKKIDLLKTRDIFKKYPIILFFQHNNLTVNDWSNLRNNIKQINETTIFITKNSIVEKILSENILSQNKFLESKSCMRIQNASSLPNKTRINNPKFKNLVSTHSFRVNELEKIHNIFQGPNFILGCQTIEQLNSIWNLIKSMSNIIFVGGLFHNQLITHLDLEKLLQLHNCGISTNTLLQELFFNALNIESSMLKLLNANFIIQTLKLSQLKSIHSLTQIQDLLKKS